MEIALPTKESKENYVKSLMMTEVERNELQNRTSMQANSPLWHKERKKRLTASNFGTACKLRKTTNKIKRAFTMLQDINPYIRAIKWGRNKEKFAIKKFEESTGYVVTSCGLFIDAEYPFLAASPDGLVGNDALIEVKCPVAGIKEGISILEGVKNKKINFLSIKENKLELKKNNNYYYQIQGQLHITQRNLCYFVAWVPNDIFIQIIKRDDEFWELNMLEKLKSFYLDGLLPVVLSKDED